jgi:membrane protein implicated in regulation of membrane protease activity
LFGLAIGVGFFASPWTAVMYAVSAMAANLIVRRIVAIKKQPAGETATVAEVVTGNSVVATFDGTDAGSIADGRDSMIEDFGGINNGEESVIVSTDGGDKIIITS